MWRAKQTFSWLNDNDGASFEDSKLSEEVCEFAMTIQWTNTEMTSLFTINMTEGSSEGPIDDGDEMIIDCD